MEATNKKELVARIARSEALAYMDKAKNLLESARLDLWKHGATSDLRQMLLTIDDAYENLILSRIGFEREFRALMTSEELEALVSVKKRG